MSRGTQHRGFRCPPELWEAFGHVAADRGLSRSDLLRRLIEHEVERSRAATGDLFDHADTPA